MPRTVGAPTDYRQSERPLTPQRTAIDTGSPVDQASKTTIGAYARAVARHPGLWAEALRFAIAASPRRWWLRTPFLPVPTKQLLAWRAMTAYGTAEAPVVDEDVEAFLRWRRAQRRARR